MIVLISCIDLNKKEKIERERLISEFPDVPRDSTFTGIIDTTFTSPIIYRSTLYVTLKDGRKFNTSASGMPRDVFGRWEIAPSFIFGEFLEKGDTIYKPKNKDSLYVLKNDLKFGYHLVTKEYSDSVFHRK